MMLLDTLTPVRGLHNPYRQAEILGSRTYTDLDAASVLLPFPRGPPVEGIAVLLPSPCGPLVGEMVPTNGWACSVDPSHCAYCCRSLKGMESHVRTHPNRPPSLKNGYCEGVALQVLFSVFSCKYFEVEPALASTSNTNPLTHIICKFINIPPGNLSPISHHII